MLATTLLLDSGAWLADLYPGDDPDPQFDAEALREQIEDSAIVQARLFGPGYIITPVPETA